MKLTAPLLADPDYRRLKQHLIDATGLAYYSEKDEQLSGHVARRLAAVDLPGCGPYLAFLQAGEAGERELQVLVRLLTIGETYFFRHQEVFDALKDRVLPELIEKNRETRQLRIWSAGCSRGAEPFSISILLRRHFGPRIAGWNISILGTDINQNFLSQARSGRFGAWNFRCTPAEVTASCFTERGQKREILETYRDGVTFQHHNLVPHEFPSVAQNLFAFDLILCRNVMIYFNRDINRRLVGQFHSSLVDGGWLIVGHAEHNMQDYGSFDAVRVPGAILYQKERTPRVQRPLAPTPIEQPAARPVTVASPPRPVAGHPHRKPAVVGRPAPDHAEELAGVRVLLDAADWSAAADRIDALLAREPLDPILHFHRALILEQTGHPAGAERALGRAIYLDRGFALAHLHAGLVRQRRGDAPGAVRAYRNVVTLLERANGREPVPAGDGMTSTELRDLARLQLAVLEG